MNDRTPTSPWERVWIIGASHGIGRAFAELCSARGAQVIVSARSADELETMAGADARMVPMPLDATSSDQVEACVADLVARDLLPDLTLYNAGMYEPVRGLGLDVAVFERHMEVNYFGAVRVLQHLLPHLEKRGTGHVGLVASLAGYFGLPKAAAYGSSKAALISLCESLKPAADKAGLTVSVVNPGFVETRMTANNRFKMPYLMTPEDAARAMYDGLAAKRFEVAFPAPFVRRMKLLHHLPYGLLFRFMRKMS